MHVCLFDIDGTLIHTGGAGLLALRRAMLTVFDDDAGSTELVTTGRTDRAIVEDLFRQHGIEPTEETWHAYSAAYLQHLPVALAECRGRVIEGIPELLSLLSARGDVVLGLLTGNSNEGARHKLAHYELAEHFEFGGFGGEHTNRDDVARAVWSQIQERFCDAVAADRISIIGDTPLDIRCARAIGAQAVAVATGTHSVEELRGHSPDLLVEDFSDPDVLLRFLQLK